MRQSVDREPGWSWRDGPGDQRQQCGRRLLFVVLVLQRGESTTVQLDLSTATCDPTDGYQRPPGTYQLKVPIEDGRVSTSATVA